MHNLSEELYLRQAENTQPWITRTPEGQERQKQIQALLAKHAGATFGKNCFVADDARVFTDKLYLGDGSWIASGAIVRGVVHIAPGCSVNPYAHIAGRVTIGRFCRIASLASIYGFNHGFSKDHPGTLHGVTLQEEVWVGANSVIVDGVEIGAHCVVAAGAVVTKSFPPFQVVGGNPAAVLFDWRDKHAKPEIRQA